MRFIKKIKKISHSAKKISNVKKVLERIRTEIKDAAEVGDTSVGIKQVRYINEREFLTDVEEGRVIGTLKRQGFKIKSGWDPDSQSFWCSFVVSW